MRHEEYQLGVAVADMLHARCAPGVVWTHIGHGEERTKRAGARLKRAGLNTGWADYIFLMPAKIGHNVIVCFLELKRPGTGRLSADQRKFRERVVALGCRYAVVNSPEKALVILKTWGIVSGIAVAA
jgi:VRR-NUC domain